MFEQDYKSLNKEQQQVVHTTDRNLLVLAPAGTGKTKVVAMRTAQLLKEGVLPKEILCLTFTNKAAKEMRERVLFYNKEQGPEIIIKTFHSFCYYLICHEKEASHFSFPCTLLDESDALDIVQKIIMQNKIDDTGLYYPELMHFIEKIKQYALLFPTEQRYKWNDIIKQYLEEIPLQKSDTFNFIKRFGRPIFNTYQRYLKENNSVDFMDLVMEATYLLEQDTIRCKWQEQFKQIQVDEMQDTSVREYQIIKQLAEKSNLSLFGDFNQTIYEWRGSNPQKMLEQYEKAFNPLTIKLQTNYRSTQVLLEAANDYIKSSRLYPVYCKPCATVYGEQIDILEAYTKEEEVAFLLEQIREDQQQEISSVILTRTNSYAKDISKSFSQQGVRCTVVEDIKLFRRKEVKDLLAFFEYAINERNNHALLKILEHPYMGMPSWLLKTLKSCKDCYMYLHDWFRMESRDPYSGLEEAYKQDKIVVLDVESTGLSTTSDEIIQIAAICYGANGVSQQLDLVVKPTKKVGDSYRVHGFSDEYLQKEGIAPTKALELLTEFVQGKVIVGHNVNYDMQIINSMLERLKMKKIEGCLIYDTLDLSYKVYPKLENHKLDTLSKLIVTDVKPTHNAMQDILATSEVLTHLLEKIREKKQERLEKIEAYYCYVEEYKKKLMTLMPYILNHTPQETLTFLMKDCQFEQYYNSEQKSRIRMFYRLIKGLEKDKVSRTDQVIELLTFSALHYSEIEQSDLFKGSIPIITIHQAKGLEFDHVYIVGCNEGYFPSKRSIKEHHLEEELRLFYVAMTRAKRKLSVSYIIGKKRSMLVDYIGNQYKNVKKCRKE